MLSLTFLPQTWATPKVAAYLIGPGSSVQAVKSALEAQGLQVIAQHEMSKEGPLTTLVWTHAQLRAAAQKKGRGFAAVLRVLINGRKNEVRAQNPQYFLPAFLQKDNTPAVADELTNKLSQALGKVTQSEDALPAKELAKYHYMMSMPYYEDTLELASGDNTELYQKLKSKSAKQILFDLDFGNGSRLLGLNMGPTVEKFIDTIGVDNAALLPYTVLIEDGRATALHAKYYIALSYPALTMGQFMKIVNTPGAIEEALKNAF